MIQLTLIELMSALHVVEQRKAFREEEQAAKKALIATQKKITLKVKIVEEINFKRKKANKKKIKNLEASIEEVSILLVLIAKR